MSLTPEQMDKKLDEHFAFEAADDVEGVLSTLSHDATHDIIGWPPGPTRGPEGARDLWRTAVAVELRPALDTILAERRRPPAAGQGIGVTELGSAKVHG